MLEVSIDGDGRGFSSTPRTTKSDESSLSQVFFTPTDERTDWTTERDGRLDTATTTKLYRTHWKPVRGLTSEENPGKQSGFLQVAIYNHASRVTVLRS